MVCNRIYDRIFLQIFMAQRMGKSMTSKKQTPRITSGIESMIEESSKWYHDSTQWSDDSWIENKSCWYLIKEEMLLVDELYETSQAKAEKYKQLAEGLREALEKLSSKKTMTKENRTGIANRAIASYKAYQSTVESDYDYGLKAELQKYKQLVQGLREALGEIAKMQSWYHAPSGMYQHQSVATEALVVYASATKGES